MRRYLSTAFIGVVAPFFTGCIALPIPHDQQMSPRFIGVVRDAATGAPIPGVKVTLTDYSEVEKGRVEKTTDSNGRYDVVDSKRETWLVVFLLPGDAFPHGKVTFDHPSYHAVEESRHTARGSVGSGMYSGLCFEVNVQMRRKEPNRVAGGD